MVMRMRRWCVYVVTVEGDAVWYMTIEEGKNA